MSCVISEADLDNPVHAAGVLQCLEAYAADSMGLGQGLRAEVRARLLSDLKVLPQKLVLLAQLQGAVVGVAICFGSYSTFAAKPRLNVHDLSVLPEQRGQGIGRQLLRAVLDRARAGGCCGVTLEVRQDNAAAQALYRSLGFAAGASAMEFWEHKF